MEKQASSEIAESRERFEQWAICKYVKWKNVKVRERFGANSYMHPNVNDDWIAWQAAERDTRERCAQLLLREAHLSMGNLAVAQTLTAMAERIRGKE